MKRKHQEIQRDKANSNQHNNYRDEKKSKFTQNKNANELKSATSENFKSASLSVDLLNYLEGVATTINSETDADIEESIVGQCFKEIDAQEEAICINSQYCRLIEIIMCSTQTAAVRFLHHMRSLKKKILINLLNTPTASRLFDALFYRVCQRITNDEIDLEIAAWCEFLTEIWHNSSSSASFHFVLRAFTRATAGLPAPKHKPPPLTLTEDINKKKRKKATKEPQRQSLLLEKFERRKMSTIVENCCLACLRIGLDWPSICARISEDSVSILVQDLLLIDQHVNKSMYANSIMQRIISDAIESPDYAKIMLATCRCKKASRVIESMLFVSKSEYAEEFGRIILKGSLIDLAMHPFANFVVQRYLEALRSNQAATDSVDTIMKQFDEMLKSRNYCVIISMVKAAQYTNDELQSMVVKKLASHFDCTTKSIIGRFLPRMLQFGKDPKPEDDIIKDSKDGIIFDVSGITYFGSGLVAANCQLRKAKRFIKSVNALAPITIVNLACHMLGSRVIDAIVESKTLPFDVVHCAIVEPLLKNCIRLAHDRIGSRVLENVLARSNLVDKQKRRIVVEQLKLERNALQKTIWGRAVIANLKLDQNQNKLRQTKT